MAKLPSNSPKATAAAALLAGTAAIFTPFYTMWEGTKLSAYLDSVGVVTICSGDTRNVKMGMRVTQEECDRRTKNIFDEYGAAVKRAMPGVENSPFEWAAYTSFHANTGAIERATIRRLFNADKRVEACRFIRKYRFAGGRELNGLIFRREGEGTRVGEYELCLVGAVPADLGFNIKWETAL